MKRLIAIVRSGLLAAAFWNTDFTILSEDEDCTAAASHFASRNIGCASLEKKDCLAEAHNLRGTQMTLMTRAACPYRATFGPYAQYIGLCPIIPAIMDPMRHCGAYIAGINVGTTWLPEKKRQGNKLYKHTKK